MLSKEHNQVTHLESSRRSKATHHNRQAAFPCHWPRRWQKISVPHLNQRWGNSLNCLNLRWDHHHSLQRSVSQTACWQLHQTCQIHTMLHSVDLVGPPMNWDQLGWQSHNLLFQKKLAAERLQPPSGSLGYYWDPTGSQQWIAGTSTRQHTQWPCPYQGEGGGVKKKIYSQNGCNQEQAHWVCL